MPRTVYALLVGIDAYQPPVPRLSGCVNDVRAMEALLRHRVTGDNQQLELLVLTDAAASRQAIIDGFRQHLTRARQGDVALFCYSGHGSQEPAPPEFWDVEPDRKNETLVCYDSRTRGRFDLADKELAKLLDEVAANGPDLVVVLDCCHSGTGTRAIETTSVRRAPADQRQRPLDSFLVTPEDISATLATRGTAAASDWLPVVGGRRVVFSACRAEEEAREYRGSGEQRGAFSYFLTDTLQRTGSGLSYRDLFKRASALVRNNVLSQSPVLEASDAADLDQPFLGVGLATTRPVYTLSFDAAHGWVVDGGAVHGIVAGTGDDTTRFALYPLAAAPDTMADPRHAVGEARVMRVLPQLSVVEVQLHGGTTLEQAATYRAVVVALALPPLGVVLAGDVAGCDAIRSALASAGPGGGASPFVREADAQTPARLRVHAGGDRLRITHAADAQPLSTDIPGYDPSSARQVVERLEHIARWTTIAELANPASRLRPDAVRMEVFRVAGPPTTRDPASTPLEALSTDDEIRLEYSRSNGAAVAPQIKIKLSNTTDQRLFCVLLDLTERFAITSALLPGGGAWLGPGEELWAFNGDAITAALADELWRQGVTEYRDVIKLIVSTEESDATLLEQGNLQHPRVARAVRSAAPRTSMDRLFRRASTRDLGAAPEAAIVDWTSSEVAVRIVRPLDQVPLGSAPAELAAGVSVLPHAGLQAKARLSTVSEAGRDLGNLALPALLRDDPDAQPFQFSASRGSDPGLAVLELSDVVAADSVTPDNPLVLRVATHLAAGERVLPLGHDGEFFLPLGSGRAVDGGLEIEIGRLPAPVVGVRSLTGSIRIFFQKVLTQRFGKQLGVEFEHPILAAAYVDHEGRVTYWRGVSDVRERVAAAERIVVFLHGIIGDTRGMVASTRAAYAPARDGERPLAKRYDLMLAFDYENINTTIEDNARALKQRLAAVGLHAGHGKCVHIVAHSMGGLVARWFVEREGGNAVVERLVMLGTPNAGSPWPRIQDFATAALALGLNGLTATFWPARIAGALVGGIEKIDVSLDQMQPGSDLLRSLDSSADPGIQYRVIAGNTSLIAAALQPTPGEESNHFERLMHRLKLGNALHLLTSLAFFGQPNDIAVTVASIRSLALDRRPAVTLLDVACDHITYFSTPAGLRTLEAALNDD